MIYIIFVIAIIYILLLTSFIIGFDKLPTFQNKNYKPKNTFTIVIPFRNEAHHLPDLLNSLSNIDYPSQLFEILLVNDDSEDEFRPIITQFFTDHPNLNFHLIESSRSTGSPKKDALNTAINLAKFDWIITTDSDCIVPESWLLLFNQFIEEKHVLFIGGPVKFRGKNSLLFHFQNLHFISLIGSTIGGFGLKKPFICNGANLCYHKETFFKINGFQGNTNIASGDDVFLLEKIRKAYPGRTGFLKSFEAMVETNSEQSWELFFNQQIRWVSKSSSYKQHFTSFVGLTVLMINSMLIFLAIFACINPHFWKFFLLLFVLKTTVDLILIYKTSRFLRIPNPFQYFLGIGLLYPFFIVFISGLSLLMNYSWKGRTFNK